MKKGILLPDISKKLNKRNNISQFLSRDISLGRKTLTSKQKVELYKDFATLTEAGIDLLSVLNISIEGSSSPIIKRTLIQIKDSILKGNNIAQAFKETSLFTEFEIAGLLIGEETGRLNEVLKEFVKFFNIKEETRRRIISLASYPIIVFITAIGAVGFMLYFIVPMFSDIFSRFGHELPALTSLIIKLSHGLSHYALLFFTIIIAIIIFIYVEHEKIWFKKLTSQALLKTPFINNVIKANHLGRFCMSMELLLGAKTPLLKSIQLAKGMVDFYPITSILSLIEKDILSGIPLHIALSKYKIFDKRFCSMIKVAEEINQLDEMFGRLKTQYLVETDYKMTVLSNILEPLIIIVMGIFVAIILISMYLPIFKLGVSVGDY